MHYVILCEVALFVLFILFSWVDNAQLWLRSYVRGRMEVYIVGCDDIQYAIDHGIPGMVLYIPRNKCAISEPIVIGSVAGLTLTNGRFVATDALGERPLLEVRGAAH